MSADIVRWRGALRAHWPLLLVLSLAVTLDVSAAIALSILLKEIFDVALPREDGAYLRQLIAGTVGVVALATVALAAVARALAELSARVVARVRDALFSRLGIPGAAPQPASSPEHAMQRLFGDIDALEILLTEGLPRIIRGALLCLSCFAIMVWLEWRLTLCLLATMAALALAPKLLAGRAAAASVDRQRAQSRLGATVDEVLRGQSVIRAFGLSGYWNEQYRQQHHDLTEGLGRQIFTGRLVLYMTTISGHVITVVTVGLGAWLAHAGYLSSGALVGYVVLLMPLSRGIQNISAAAPVLLRAVGSLRAIDEHLAEAGPHRDQEPHAPLAPLTQGIRIHGLTFSYPGRPSPAIHDVSFEIPRGKSVAIVGSSGSGKSTLLSLLLGFWRPSRGAVEWDGTRLEGEAAGAHLAHLGVVFQESQLFDTSVRHNIRLGRLSADDAAVQRAANEAEAHDFVTRLPEGYASTTGPGGRGLSGGQRQRIALARALIRDPQVLVLDEPTASLDVRAEASINETLEALRPGRTVVHVTHRLHAIRSYDRIVVMHRGRVVAVGTHQALMEHGGHYREMVERQAGIELSHDGSHATVTADRLRRIPLFASSERSDLAGLAARFATEHFPADRVVVSQGEAGDRFYLVARGQLRATVTGPQGHDQHAADMGPGDFFGEIALLRNTPRSATVRTRGPCTLLSLRREDFERMLASSSTLSRSIEQVAAARAASDSSMLDGPEGHGPVSRCG